MRQLDVMLRGLGRCRHCDEAVEAFREFLVDGGRVLIPWRHAETDWPAHEATPAEGSIEWGSVLRASVAV